MKGLLTVLSASIIVLFALCPAYGALSDLGVTDADVTSWHNDNADGNALIRDTTTNVTWYDWSWPWNNQGLAIAWADNLTIEFNGGTEEFDQWRLPTEAEWLSMKGSSGATFDNIDKSKYWLTDAGTVFDWEAGAIDTTYTGTNASAMAVTPEVPLPLPILLLGTGLVGLIGFRRKR
jgi:hypothetical protein